MDRKFLFISVFSALFFTTLFYRNDIGLNLLLFEGVVVFLLIITRQLDFKSKMLLLGLGCFITTSVFTVITYSLFVYVVHWMVCVLFAGLIIYPRARSLITSFQLGIDNSLSSQSRFFHVLRNRCYKGKGVMRRLYRAGIFIVPLFIVVIFFLFYQRSNPVFERLFAIPWNGIQRFLRYLFEDVDIVMLITFLSGLLICNFIFLRRENSRLIENDIQAQEGLARRKRRSNQLSGVLSLKNEYRAAIFLFASLNILLLILNVVDIYAVWFHFEWKGQYLKQYVHEGTYLLIMSILISAGLVLYYFRRNLNFYPKQKLLRSLAVIWLAQNALLIISVGIRNYWYIHYFALAYKRIGVYIFLVLTLAGLYTVYVKVRERKSIFYLLRTNALTWLIVLTVSSIINWDVVIAKYNFAKSDKAYIELAFLAGLPNKALPYIDKSNSELQRINGIQKNLFHFEGVFMRTEDYYILIQNRKKGFLTKCESKNILEWNFAEWSAYKKLKN